MKNNIWNEHKEPIIKIAVCLLLLIVGIAVPQKNVSTILLLVSFAVIGYETMFHAARGLLHGDFFNEDTLMCIASIGAVALGDYKEAVMILLFFTAGELFEDAASDRSRESIEELLDLRPDHANLMNGKDTVTVDPSKVRVGDIIVIYPGEKIPLDGTVTDGVSSIDAASLTGESVPVPVTVGDRVLSGAVNMSGKLLVAVDREFSESTASKILALIENAPQRRSKIERFTRRFAKYYTPIVVFAALAVAIIPGIITGDFTVWVRRALTLLVVSCPCALVISVPLGFFCGLGAASRNGILIKGSNFLELLASVDTVAFDKTGTLTEGCFKVVEVCGDERLLQVTAAAEKDSPHPIAHAIVSAAADIPNAHGHRHIAGLGVECILNGKRIITGNRSFLCNNGINVPECAASQTVVHCAEDGKYLGYITVRDTVKQKASLAVSELKTLGINHTVMLSGDREDICLAVGKELGIDAIYSSLLPAQKAEKLRGFSGITAFVGDGINDAPVITEASVGIAMGAIGSDAAIESADVVIADDDITKLSLAVKVARKTMSIVRQNVIFSLGIKILIMLLGILGITGVGLAVFGDVGVLILAILNSTRAFGRPN